MKATRLFLVLAFWAIISRSVSADDGLVHREWKVDGAAREALVYVPSAAKTNAAPVVFAFHGHGGSMRNAARTFGYHTIWPEAIVVYMQGLNTPGRLTDPEGKKPGWQHGLGDQGDRDLKFFDAVLASLKKDFKVDAKRIYSTGHSNGGGFTYLLWAARGDQFAAFAPSAAVGRMLVEADPSFPRNWRVANDCQAELIKHRMKLQHCERTQLRKLWKMKRRLSGKEKFCRENSCFHPSARLACRG